MKPRKVRRQATGQVGSSYDPYYRRESGAERGKSWRKWLVRSLKVAVLLVVAGFIIFWGLAVTNVRVTDTAYASEVEETAQTLIAEHTGWSNLLLLPAEQLASDIQAAQNEQITGVTVTKNWLSRGITVAAVDRSPHLLWRTNNRLFTVDQQGRIIAEVGEGQPGLPEVMDGSNVAVNVNDQAVPAQFVTFTEQVFRDLAASTGVMPTMARIEATTNELLVDTNKSYYIRFDTTASLSDQLQAVKTTLQQGHQPINVYIDVRLPYKVYYR